MSAVSNTFPSAQVIERALFLNPTVSGRITQQNIRVIAEIFAHEKGSSLEDLAIKVSRVHLRQRHLPPLKLLNVKDCKILATALKSFQNFTI